MRIIKSTIFHKYNDTIKNTKADSIRYCNSKYKLKNMQKAWRKMNLHNLKLSTQNIKNNILIANKNKIIGVSNVSRVVK